MTDNFETAFNAFMSGDKKDFNISKRSLYSLYPETFKKDRTGKIKVLNLTSAKDILRKYYLPDQIKDNKISVYYTKNNKYTTKTIYYKQRENKFKVLDESEEMKNLNKENINDSAYSLRSKYPQFTFKQIYGYLYRKLF